MLQMKKLIVCLTIGHEIAILKQNYKAGNKKSDKRNYLHVIFAPGTKKLLNSPNTAW